VNRCILFIRGSLHGHCRLIHGKAGEMLACILTYSTVPKLIQQIVIFTVKPFNMAALNFDKFACKLILVPNILANPNYTVPALT